MGVELVSEYTLAVYSALIRERIEHFSALPVNAQILECLRNQLSAEYCYHSSAHTLDVLGESLLFAFKDGLSLEQQELLSIAACYHDSGYLKGPEAHEQRSAQLALAAMREAGVYSEQDCGLVHDLILDTALKPEAKDYGKNLRTALSPYLLDADLSNLGRSDFFEKLQLVEKEYKESRYHSCLKLLENHEWLSPAAKNLRSEQKRANQLALEEAIKRRELGSR